MIDLRQVGASRRESAYRRGLAAAFLASLLLHSILLLHFPAPGAGAWRQWSSPTAPHIGFAGPEEILPELNPQDSPVDQQEALASARIETLSLKGSRPLLARVTRMGSGEPRQGKSPLVSIESATSCEKKFLAPGVGVATTKSTSL